MYFLSFFEEKVSKSLRSVIAEFKLPIDVQLVPSDSTQCMVSSGNQRRAITGKVQLQLYERHKFHYIYGNPVCKGKPICQNNLYISMSLFDDIKWWWNPLVHCKRK